MSTKAQAGVMNEEVPLQFWGRSGVTRPGSPTSRQVKKHRRFLWKEFSSFPFFSSRTVGDLSVTRPSFLASGVASLPLIFNPRYHSPLPIGNRGAQPQTEGSELRGTPEYGLYGLRRSLNRKGSRPLFFALFEIIQ